MFSSHTVLCRFKQLARQIATVSAYVKHNYVVIKANAEKNEDEELKFPVVWLRENCQCPQCFDKNSLSRMLDFSKFNINVKPVDVKFDDSAKELCIKWEDAHSSCHGLEWLKSRQFSHSNRNKYLKTKFRPERQLWRKEDYELACKSFKYDECINTDEGLRGWLHALTVNGVAVIKDTPHQKSACRRLAERVGFIRRTHYGEEFVVMNEEELPTTSTASPCKTLQMHTDMPYYEYKPGLNLLHCLVQTQSPGGTNPLTDGLWVIDYMQKHFGEEFKILCNTMVDWVDVGDMNGNKFHSRYRAPVICLDREGQLQRVNHSTPQRDSHFNVPLEDVEPWYRASAIFVKLIHEGAYDYKMQPGDILTFDNTRLIHGRTGYTDVHDNIRQLIGAHLDWDEVFSRLRVLSTPTNTNSG